MNIVVSPATPERRAVALRLLFARFPVEEQDARLRDALHAAECGRLNLEELLLAESDGLSVGAALVMQQPDGVALVWPPVVSCGAIDQTAVESALMEEVCRRIDAAAAKLGQCLLTPDDVAEAELLARHGFEHAADLFFLARALTTADASEAEGPSATDKIRWESFCDGNAARFADVIEQSYLHSLDCPHLKDFRRGAEAVESHKLAGQFDPALWRLYSIEGRDAGVLLLNEHPDQDAIELVYIGVTPAARGLGLGRRMLREGVPLAASRGRAALFLAVDTANRYANDLYREFAFAELARRRIMLLRPKGCEPNQVR